MMKTRKGYKVYPLTVAQKFHLYYLPHCPSAAVLNIGTSLTIEVEIDWDVLKQSINKAYERSEAMRVRLAKDKEGNYYQYVVKHEDQDIDNYQILDHRRGLKIVVHGLQLVVWVVHRPESPVRRDPGPERMPYTPKFAQR